MPFLVPAISRLRSGADHDRAVPDPLVCAGLYRRHPARLALCARADPQRAPVGRTGAADGRRLRRFRALGDARHHPRRPDRLRAVLQSGAFPRAPARGRAALEGRHVVPRRLRRLRAGGRAVRAQARHLDPVARRPHLRGRPIGLFLGRIANFINGELWGRPADVPWAMVFPGRRTVAAPSEPALRGGARRAGAVHRALAVACAPAR